MAAFFLGAIIGFLLAIFLLFRQQISFLANNADSISAAGQIYSGFSTLAQKL